MCITGKLKEKIVTVGVAAALVTTLVTAKALTMTQEADPTQDSVETYEMPECTLQEIFNLSGTPKKREIDGFTETEGNFIVSEDNTDIAKFYDANSNTWTQIALPTGGISWSKNNCINTEINKGDLLIQNGSSVNVYRVDERGGLNWIKTYTGITVKDMCTKGHSHNIGASDIATTFSRGKCGIAAIAGNLVALYDLGETSEATYVGRIKLPQMAGIINLTSQNREYCGSCHADVDFNTGARHAVGVQANDANCPLCHLPSNVWYYHYSEHSSLEADFISPN